MIVKSTQTKFEARAHLGQELGPDCI